ncbi:UDP-3-O-(3-hydroxymyristoyl)glucosamine N-acyltransferase [Desulfonema limicola]|uniref:UDP-3-O-acylglucosamine N-acyltransferase n=1 Tax=Desulfonema limicola TaxID=45656 RepID=A0A975BAY3_9BACT|nr:UDP-3-O-(3-hydroxymyristoyl)glucosamine N-acyltransferase [Desulfonema limicola]QTA81940.1 UDP-3-O-(3-hydroxymyristoyl)glucosamine N-acyltransferase [Desulfonema limicola]
MEISLADIARTIGGKLIGNGNKIIRGASCFENADKDHIILAGSAKYLNRLDETKAGAVIVPSNFDTSSISRDMVAVENPMADFSKLLEIFYPGPKVEQYISPNAVIGDNFISGNNISISHFVSIGSNVSMGDRVRIHSGVVIEDNVTIGSDVEIHSNVSIYARSQIGSRVIIHSGTVIGSDGFGFAPDKEKYQKIPHTGIVCIEDDVEIGALNAIDRATFGETRIKRGVKTDNFVHIAHNVVVGEDTLLVAQVGISGSTTLGNHVIVAGQAGISGHLNIGSNAIVGPRAGIAKDVPDNEIVSGAPEMPHKLWLRVQNIIPKLPELKKKISELEKRLKKVEEK